MPIETKNKPGVNPVKGLTTDPVVENTTEVKQITGHGDDNLQPKAVSSINKLKQQKVAEVLKGGIGGATVEPGGVIAGRAASYSGNDTSISGSLASTPKSRGNSRGDSRYGKKIDATVKQINDLASEQVIVEVTKPEPISSGSVQGGNRSPRNNTTVRTKSKGAVPASPLFQRSIDEIRADELVYGPGQIVKSSFANYQDAPTETMVKDGNGIYQNVSFATPLVRGNYVPRSMTFTINKDAVVTDMSFEVDNISVVENDENILNAAAPHAKIHANKAELHRRDIDATAGDESKDNWSPLARAINQPTETISYLKDLELDAGNVAYMAARFAQLSLAYQVNRVAKDGTLNAQPIEEAFVSLIDGEQDFPSYKKTIQDVLRDKTAMAKGSPALMIAAFDSIPKFKTKGDVLNHPNGLKSHLFKGLNFMGNLKASDQLIKYIEKNQTFSTIDGQYDGVRPTFIHDTYLLTSPFDWNDQFSFSNLKKYDPEMNATLANEPFRYGYKDLRSTYVTTAHHFLLKGIYDWLSRHARNIRSVFVERDKDGQEDDKSYTVTVPIAYSTTKFSTWTFMVMAALSDVERNRKTTMREIEYYNFKNSTDLFADLVSLKGYPITAANQFTFTDIGEPIEVGTMTPEAKLYWLYGERFWVHDEESRGVTQTVDYRHVVMPWYFTENNFKANGINGVAFDTDAFAMSWPKVRSGIVLEQLTDLLDFGERNARLAIDRMLYPLVTSAAMKDFAAYKYDVTSDGLVKLVLKSDDIKYETFLKVPRELGLRVALPAGYATPLLDGTKRKITDNFRYETSVRAKMYVGDLAAGTSHSGVINQDSINIDRGSIYKQEWYYNRAEVTGSSPREGGFTFSMKEMFKVAANAANASMVEGKSVFTPFAKLGSGSEQSVQDTTENKVITFQKAMWARLQILPFVISPWDVTAYASSLGEDGQKYDPYDHAYIFGLVGFESSYFEEDHYNRLDKQIQEGYAFTQDLFIEETSLLK